MKQDASKQPGQSMTRHDFLKLTGVWAGTAVLSACVPSSLTPTAGTAQSTTSSALATGSLPIPALLAPQLQNGTKVFNLSLQQGQSHFLAGLTTDTFGINGSYLGPTLRASQGEKVLINVTNHIGESTTLHWHGMHIPAEMDGGPHQMIANNAQW